jgi:amidase
MIELTYASATELARAIRRGDVSSEEVIIAYLNRIEEINPKLNAFVYVATDEALSQARDADRTRGQFKGPLHGVPVSIKDTIETAGIPTVAGTRLRQSFIPESDAPVVARLKQAGAIILGKTNVPECAMDYRCENPVFGRTSNPWDLGRVPGGSSGGEAAAIASGCSPAGVGSDLGGSIRVPAHFCGITGLKPTPGRIPGSGHFPPGIGPFALGASLGPMARRVEDLALMLKVLAGFEPTDPASVPIPPRNLDQIRLDGMKVMWYTDDGISPTTAATRQAVYSAVATLADRGFEISERRPTGIERSHELWYVWLAQSGVPGVISLYDGKQELMGPLLVALKQVAETQSLAMSQFLSAWYARDMLRAEVVSQMSDWPIIIAPVAAIPAFEHDHRNGFEIEGKQVEYLKAFSYAQAYNLLGLPVVVVPCGRSPEGLPIGVQVVGRPFEEETVLAVASIIEEALGGYERPPI